MNLQSKEGNGPETGCAQFCVNVCVCEVCVLEPVEPMCLGEVLSSEKHPLTAEGSFKKASILSLLLTNIVKRYLKTVL